MRCVNQGQWYINNHLNTWLHVQRADDAPGFSQLVQAVILAILTVSSLFSCHILTRLRPLVGSAWM